MRFQVRHFFVGFFSLVVFTLSYFYPLVFAADSSLKEAAAKEGKVVVYTVMNAKQHDTLRRAFEKKHPGISVETYRAGSATMANKVLAEARAGSLKADALFAGGAETMVFKKEGLLQKYVSPEAKVPEAFQDPEGYWTNMHPLLFVTAYNTSQVKPKDAPRTMEDLLRSKWKGQMMMDQGEYHWFATLQSLWGREKAISYCKKLASQQIKFFSGHTKIANLIAAGEASIGINMYGYRVSSLKKKGAAIDWVALDPVIAILETVSVTKAAEHPNAAKLWVDFNLSVEGQNLIRSFGRVPGRIGIEPRDEELAKVKARAHPTDLKIISERGLKPFADEYREIFGLK